MLGNLLLYLMWELEVCSSISKSSAYNLRYNSHVQRNNAYYQAEFSHLSVYLLIHYSLLTVYWQATSRWGNHQSVTLTRNCAHLGCLDVWHLISERELFVRPLYLFYKGVNFLKKLKLSFWRGSSWSSNGN